MALIKPTPQEERTTTLNPSKQLPRDSYVIRFFSQSFGPSKSSGNPMITLQAEIVSPNEVKSPFTGETLQVVGARTKMQYFSLQVKDEHGQVDPQATKDAIDRYCDFRKRCGLEVPEEGIDNENPTLDFKGVCVDAILDSEEVMQRKTPTPEQKAQGKQGDSIKGPDGKEIRSYFPFVSMVLGPSAFDASGIPF